MKKLILDEYRVVNAEQVKRKNPIFTVNRSFCKMINSDTEDLHYQQLEDIIPSINKLIAQYTGNNAHYTFDNIIGVSDISQQMLERAKVAAASDDHVMLLGEMGVGKNVIAQAVHNSSQRANGPFITVNCNSFSKELIDKELFGDQQDGFMYDKKEGNIGKFELAKNGTLFLAGIDELPLDVQAFLLRVIEQKCIMRKGSDALTQVDVRIIAASNKNLAEKIKWNLFRKDLFYRLGTVRINIPPLRKRTEDIIILANYFIERICARICRKKVELTEDANALLQRYQWPMNIRELQNLLEGILSTTYVDEISGDIIATHLGYNNGDKPEIKTVLSDKERVINALKINRNNKVKAAEYLGISRRTLYRRIEEYELKQNFRC